MVRAIGLTNASHLPLEDLQVEVACNPPFARGSTLRFDRLQPGEHRQIAPLDLQPDHAFLANLGEAVQASVTVSVTAGAREVARTSQAVEVLAYDQWADLGLTISTSLRPSRSNSQPSQVDSLPSQVRTSEDSCGCATRE